jgi:hypothetical protein
MLGGVTDVSAHTEWRLGDSCLNVDLHRTRNGGVVFDPVFQMIRILKKWNRASRFQAESKPAFPVAQSTNH